MKYRVYVPEVHLQAYIVEASTKEEAVKKLSEDMDGEIDEEDFTYSHTLEPDVYEWKAEEVK